MQLFSESLQTAFYLIVSGNSDLFEIIMLSIKVSLTSLLGSTVIGLPLGDSWPSIGLGCAQLSCLYLMH